MTRLFSHDMEGLLADTSYAGTQASSDQHTVSNCISRAAYPSYGESSSHRVQGHSRIAPIDGLRAVAMTLVIAQHSRLAPSGWMGVWLFYVISGFVICRSLVGAEAHDRGAAYKQFMIKRFFRIVPLYALYLAVGGTVLLISANWEGLRELPFLLTFTYDWQMIFQIWPTSRGWPAFAHLWTLSVEEQFYLGFPLLLLYVPRSAFAAVAGALIALGPVIRWLFVRLAFPSSQAVDPNAEAFAVYAASITQFDAFLTGALLAFIEPRLRSNPLLRRLLFTSAAVATATYVGLYVWFNASEGARGVDLIRNVLSGTMYGQGREVWVYTVVDLGCAAILTTALTSSTASRLLSNRSLGYIGRVSYGGYVFHAFVLWLLVTYVMPRDFANLAIAGRIGWFALAWTITIGLASLSFHAFEQPIIRRSRSSRAARHRPVAYDRASQILSRFRKPA